MVTALYRKSSGEVIKINLKGRPFTERDSIYYGVLADPAFPDGQEERPHQGPEHWGPLRVLGYAKIAIPGTNTVRNATQAEIDGFPAAEAADQALMDTAAAQALLETHPQFRRAFIAMAKLFLSEINTLRTQAGLAPRTRTQFLTALRGQLSKDD